MSARGELADKLGGVVARHLGGSGEVTQLRRLTGGATKGTYLFRAVAAEGERPFILQLSEERKALDPDDPHAAMPRVSGGDEAIIMQAGTAAGVPTPTVRVALSPDDGLGIGHITDFVEGETIARKILREPAFAPLRERFAAQCGEALGKLHSIDPSKLPFLIRFDAGPQVAIYKKLYRSFGVAIPALDLALQWAEDNLPPEQPLSVVHGDFRMGNVICGPEGVRAVLDWELASLGDPLQDLGWLCVKTWRFGGPGAVGGVGAREDLVAAYEKSSGRKVDLGHLAFWEAWGSIKWAIMCLMKGQAHRRTASERTVEAFAIGRRMEEPLYDFYTFLAGER